MIAPARTFDTTTTKTSTVDFDALARDVGLLAVRATAGLLLAGHGAQKLFGWWGGPDFDAIATGFAQSGYMPGRFFAFLAGSSSPAVRPARLWIRRRVRLSGDQGLGLADKRLASWRLARW